MTRTERQLELLKDAKILYESSGGKEIKSMEDDIKYFERLVERERLK